MFCAAPTVLIGIANAPEELRARRAPRRARVHRRRAAGRRHDRAHRGRARLGVTHVYGLTETSPFITICEPLPEHAALAPHERAAIKARQGVELITSGELLVVDDDGNEVPHDGETVGEIVVRGNVVMEGYYNDPEATAKAHSRRLVPYRRRGGRASGRLRRDSRPHQGRDHQRRREHLVGRGRGRAAAPPRRAGGRRRRHAAREVGRRRRTPSSCCAAGATATRAELREFVARAPGALQVPAVRITSSNELPKTATGKIQKYVLRGGRSAISAQ